MKELFEQQLKYPERHSSKGNQLKWEDSGIWYKADYTGYEGLAEYVISGLLDCSTLKKDEFVKYDLEELKYHNRVFCGVKSRNFLTDDWQIITLERLFQNRFGQSLTGILWSMQGTKERLTYLCEQTERITGIPNFGIYMTKLLTIDAFFKNEDRHMHNIAILMNGKGEFKLCPIFDNGAGLLADTTIDYPMEEDVWELMERVSAKTVSTDFDEQLDTAEELFGCQLQFSFTKKEIDILLSKASIYDVKVRERVRTILYQQMSKYRYLFQ